MTCRKHGADVSPEIVAIIPCAPGWSVAHKPSTNDDGTVWTSPVAAWAHTRSMASEPGCSCRERRVRAMVSGEYGEIELADDDSHVVPPGLIAEWRSIGPHVGWTLREALPTEHVTDALAVA